MMRPAYITELTNANSATPSEDFVQCRNSTIDYQISVSEFNAKPCSYYATCDCPNMEPKPDIAGKCVSYNFQSTRLDMIVC